MRMENKQIIELLKADVVPALGCTEPVCVALCVARARKELDEEVKSIDIVVNSGIYKNGMSAGIPHCDKVGLDVAASLGVYLNFEKGLELFADMDEDILLKSSKLHPSIIVDWSQSSLYVKCVLNNRVTCIIQGSHTNVVYVKKDGNVLFKKELEKKSDSLLDLTSYSISEIRASVDEISYTDLLFLLEGVYMNERLIRTKDCGIGLSESIHDEMKEKTLLTSIIYKVSKATENRLSGCIYPAMSSFGAGTKGLAVAIPIDEVANTYRIGLEKHVKALAFAHLLNRYINLYIGKLSSMCTCVMASSIASSAGITYLLGGNDSQISYAIRNMTGAVTGMICDGGKVGCALKVVNGSTSALICAYLALRDVGLKKSDGICAESAEDCIRNMAKLSKVNMDREIIDIMVNK